jgi:hypothetical protein
MDTQVQFSQTVSPLECVEQVVNDGSNITETIVPENCVQLLPDAVDAGTGAGLFTVPASVITPIVTQGDAPESDVLQPVPQTVQNGGQLVTDSIQADSASQNYLLLLFLVALFLIIFAFRRRRKKLHAAM